MGKWFATTVGPDFRKPFLSNLKYVAAAEEPSKARGEYIALIGQPYRKSGTRPELASAEKDPKAG